LVNHSLILSLQAGGIRTGERKFLARRTAKRDDDISTLAANKRDVAIQVGQELPRLAERDGASPFCGTVVTSVGNKGEGIEFLACALRNRLQRRSAQRYVLIGCKKLARKCRRRVSGARTYPQEHAGEN